MHAQPDPVCVHGPMQYQTGNTFIAEQTLVEALNSTTQERVDWKSFGFVSGLASSVAGRPDQLCSPELLARRLRESPAQLNKFWGEFGLPENLNPQDVKRQAKAKEDGHGIVPKRGESGGEDSRDSTSRSRPYGFDCISLVGSFGEMSQEKQQFVKDHAKHLQNVPAAASSFSPSPAPGSGAAGAVQEAAVSGNQGAPITDVRLPFASMHALPVPMGVHLLLRLHLLTVTVATSSRCFY
jgi:hypothetical protein